LGLIVTVTILSFVGSSRVAWGQGQEPEEDEPKNPAAKDPRVINDDDIDQMVFGIGEDAAKARARLDLILSLHIERLEQTCRITEPQKRKLQLAGRGAIKRLLDQVEAVKMRIKSTEDEGEQTELVQELSPLQSSIRPSFFEAGSLFSKSLKRILTGAQLAKYEEARRETRRFRHRVLVDLAVEELDAAVGFREEQRARLTKLLLENTRPVKKSDTQSDSVVFLSQVVNLPESKFVPILDKSQLASLNALLLKMKTEFGQAFEGVEFDDQSATGDRPVAPTERLDTPKRPVELTNQQRPPSLDTTP
jgi:hypothetical protein